MKSGIIKDCMVIGKGIIIIIIIIVRYYKSTGLQSYGSADISGVHTFEISR